MPGRKIDNSLYMDIMLKAADQYGWDKKQITDEYIDSVFKKTGGDVKSYMAGIYKSAGADPKTVTDETVSSVLDSYGVIDKPNTPRTRELMDIDSMLPEEEGNKRSYAGKFVIPDATVRSGMKESLTGALDAVDDHYAANNMLTPPQKESIMNRRWNNAEKNILNKYGNTPEAQRKLSEEYGKLIGDLGLEVKDGKAGVPEKEKKAYDAYLQGALMEDETIAPERTKYIGENLHSFYENALQLNKDFKDTRESEKKIKAEDTFAKEHPLLRSMTEAGDWRRSGGLSQAAAFQEAYGKAYAPQLFNDATIDLYEKVEQGKKEGWLSNLSKGVGAGLYEHFAGLLTMTRDFAKDRSYTELNQKIEDISRQVMQEKPFDGVAPVAENYSNAESFMSDLRKYDEKRSDYDKDVYRDAYGRLSKQDQNLVRSASNYYAAVDELSQEVPYMRKLGEGLGGSLGYMIEFIGSGGTGWLKGAAKAGARGVAQNIAEAGLRKTGERLVSFGAREAAKNASKSIPSRLAGWVKNQPWMVAEGVVQSVAMPSFYKNAGDRIAQGEDVGAAFMNALGDMGVENWSERIFVGGGKFGKLTGSALDFARNSTGKRTLNLISSVLEENAEEFIGDAVKRVPTWAERGSFVQAYTDYLDDKWDTFTQTSLMTGLLGGVGYVANSNIADRIRYKNKTDIYRKSLPESIVSGIDELINQSDLTSEGARIAIAEMIDSESKASKLPLGKLIENTNRYVESKLQQQGFDATAKVKETPVKENSQEFTGKMLYKGEEVTVRDKVEQDGTTLIRTEKGEDIAVPAAELMPLQDIGNNAAMETNITKNNRIFEPSNEAANEIPESISQGEYGAVPEETGRIQEASAELRRRSEEAVRDAQEAGRTISAGEKQEIESRAAESYARETGQWISMDDVFKLGVPAPGGNENDVYLSGDGTEVYKVNNLMNSKNLPDLFKRIELHNEIFPQTKYELAGFTGLERGQVYPVFKQQYVQDASFATPEEIDSYMRKLGFEQSGEAAYSNGEVTISDLRPRNVLKDAEGDIYVIDADFKKVSQKPDTGVLLSGKQPEKKYDYAKVPDQGFSIREGEEATNEIRNAFREGKKEITDRIKSVKDIIRAYRNIGKLNSSQYNSILKQLSMPNRDTEAMMREIEGMIVDNAFRSKTLSIKEKQAKQKADIRNRTAKMTLPGWLNHDMINVFTTLDVNNMTPEMLDAYWRMMEDLSKTKPKFNAFIPQFIETYESINAPAEEASRKTFVSAIEDVEKQIAAMNERTDLNDYDDYRSVYRNLRKARRQLAGLWENDTIDEIKFEQESLSLDEIEDKLKDAEGVIKSALISNISSGELADAMDGQKTGTPVYDLLKDIKRYGVDLKGMEGLSIKHLMGLENALFNASVGIATRDLYSAWSAIRANVMGKRLEGSKSKIENAYNNKRVRKLLDDSQKLKKKLEIYDASMWDVLFDAGSGKDLYENFFAPQIETAVNKMGKEKAIAISGFSEGSVKLNDFFSRIKGGDVKKISLGSLQKYKDLAGMIMKQVDYESNSKTPFEELPPDQRSYFGYLLENRDAYTNNRALEKRQRAAYELMKFDVDGRFDMESTLTNIKNEKLGVLVKDIIFSAREMLDGKMLEYNVSNAIRRGIRLNLADNYFPSFVKGKTVGVNDIDFEKTFDINSLAPTFIPSSMKARTGGINPVETDIVKVMTKAVNDTFTDYFLAPAFMQSNSAFKKAEASGGKSRTAFETMRLAMRDRLVKNYKKELASDDLKLLKQMDRWMARMTRNLLLAKIPKTVAEFASNQAGALISDGSIGWGYWNKIGVLHELADMMDLTAAKNIVKYNEMFKDATGKRPSWGEKGINAIVTINDEWTSSQIYYNTFNRTFKELSGENFDYDKAKNDTDYIDHILSDRNGERSLFEQSHIRALTRAQESFTTVNRALSATHAGILPGVHVDIDSGLGRAVSFMMSFSANEAFETARGFRQMKAGISRKDGKVFKDGLGRVTSRFVRSASYSAAMMGLYSFIASAIRPDKEPEFIANPNFIAGTCLNMALGRYGNTGGLMLNGLLGVLKWTEKQQTGKTELTNEVVEAINNGAGIYAVPMSLGQPTLTTIQKTIPHWGFMLNVIAEAGEDGLNLISGKLNEGKELTPEEKEVWGIAASLSALSAFMYANPVSTTAFNLSRTVRNSFYEKKDKKKSRTNNKIKEL